MSRYICLFIFICFTLGAKLGIRRSYFCDRVACNYRSLHEPISSEDPEDEVNRLRMEVIDDYDDGIYMANWAKKRTRALDIQTRLGYTVPQRYRWGR